MANFWQYFYKKVRFVPLCDDDIDDTRFKSIRVVVVGRKCTRKALYSYTKTRWKPIKHALIYTHFTIKLTLTLILPQEIPMLNRSNIAWEIRKPRVDSRNHLKWLALKNHFVEILLKIWVSFHSRHFRKDSHVYRKREWPKWSRCSVLFTCSTLRYTNYII